MLGARYRIGRTSPLTTTCTPTRAARHGWLHVVSQQKKDPRSDPNYRRGGDNTYWRKRTEDRRSSKGQIFSNDNEKRRRGRPAHMRSPDDTPLRDGNRDRLMGLLADRAARTLMHNSEEGSPVLHTWLSVYLKENAIPMNGNWSDVSGDNFMRKLLCTPVEEITASFARRAPELAEGGGAPEGVDPRQIAQGIMDIRHQIAKEWIEELELVADDNKLLISETLMNSLSAEMGAVTDAEIRNAHPELRGIDMQPDDSAGGGDD